MQLVLLYIIMYVHIYYTFLHCLIINTDIYKKSRLNLYKNNIHGHTHTLVRTKQLTMYNNNTFIILNEN